MCFRNEEHCSFTGIFLCITVNTAIEINVTWLECLHLIVWVLSVKRWISKSSSHCWKGFKYAEDAEKPKNELNPEDFLKNWRQFKCSGLINNDHKTSTLQHNVWRMKCMYLNVSEWCSWLELRINSVVMILQEYNLTVAI